jgi:hypothetical protein
MLSCIFLQCVAFFLRALIVEPQSRNCFSIKRSALTGFALNDIYNASR